MLSSSFVNCQPHKLGLDFGRISFQLSTFNFNLYLGGYSAEVPPLPIPNRVVKLSIADGTALRCGRVGSRHIERVPLGTLFFCACYATLSTLQCCTEGTDVYCRVVLVKRLRRTENVRGTFEGVSAPRECGQPSPLPAHRNNRSSEAR